MIANGPGQPTPSAVRPARLIAYAWGERYLDDLLSIALPAALATGNLPYVAARVPCEVVLLTEEKFNSRVDRHPTVQRIRRLCPLHVVGLDDLVHASDKYGMTLTYALHRGLSDLGSAVTESYLFFINADFIVAENSFRTALDSLMNGKRLIAAPSYCVNHGAVAPVLRPRISEGALAIAHRELAALALANLHNTVRGKTLNQRQFHLKQMDQFYWQADGNTLLGHQMPIAIVGMRPQRQVAEPNSFWDHGLIGEFCPTEQPHVLGDSDDFLMIELREKEVAQEQIALGPADPREAGECMVGWVTPYQRSFAPYPLTLHAQDLPPGIAGERAALAARMNAILAHCPAFLPSHRDHPQWDYHLGPFMTARHRYLSKRLGRITETEQPPANCLPVDRIWWQLDRAAQRVQREKAALERARDRHLNLLKEEMESLSKSAAARQREINRRFVAEFGAGGAAGNCASENNGTRVFFDTRRHKQSDKPDGAAETLKKYIREFEGAQTEADAKIANLAGIRDAADAYYERELQRLSERALHEQARLQSEYTRSIRAYVTSALVPRVRFRKAQDGTIAGQPAGGIAARLAARARYRLYRGPLRRLRQMADDACGSGAGTILIVTNGGAWAEREASRFPATCAFVSITELLTGNLGCAVNPGIKFDLCLCEMTAEHIASPVKLADAVRPCLNPGARIVGLYWHTRCARLQFDSLRSSDNIALRVFTDQFSPAKSLLLPSLDALFTPKLARRLVSRAWRRLRRALGSLLRMASGRAGKPHLPVRKAKAARLPIANSPKFGTAITIEIRPVPAPAAGADHCSGRKTSQDNVLSTWHSGAIARNSKGDEAI